jgi:SGNH domain (fused to AT3 domains)
VHQRGTNGEFALSEIPGIQTVKSCKSYHNENIQALDKLQGEFTAVENATAEYYLVLGDSYAQHLAGLLLNLSTVSPARLYAVHHGPNCMPSTPSRLVCHREKEYQDKCQNVLEQSWQLMKSRPPRVLFLAGRWQAFTPEDLALFRQSLMDFKRMVSVVVVIGVVPEPTHDPCTCLLTHIRRGRTVEDLEELCPASERLSSKDADSNRLLRNITLEAGCTYIDPSLSLCKESTTHTTRCPLWERAGLIYWDGTGHLTSYGASMLTGQFVDGKFQL